MGYVPPMPPRVRYGTKEEYEAEMLRLEQQAIAFELFVKDALWIVGGFIALAGILLVW